MKIGVSSYSFSQYIRVGKMSQIQTVGKAKEIGYAAIEFTELEPPAQTSQEEYARQISEKAKEEDMEISAYVVGANLAIADEKKRAEEIERMKRQLLVAQALGAPNFRHDVMWDYKDFRSFDEALPVIAAAAREITEYAAALGIRTMTENHGLICQEPERLERLVEAVAHPNFGLLVDIGNFLCADIPPELAVARLANLAFLVHAKDFMVTDFYDKEIKPGSFRTRACNRLTGTIVGQGCGKTQQCLDILRQAGFNGYIDVEYEGGEDCILALQSAVRYLNAHLK